ncbi:hypothetical protein NQZ68_019022 [Dissostichus eleginoides]|nr:hypothetical protein NQZ68_019022 [Dissostichus eleginoides]
MIRWKDRKSLLKGNYVEQKHKFYDLPRTHTRFSSVSRALLQCLRNSLLPQAPGDSVENSVENRGLTNRRGRAERDGQERQSGGGEHRHIVMAADEGMNCRHAAVEAGRTEDQGPVQILPMSRQGEEAEGGREGRREGGSERQQ